MNADDSLATFGTRPNEHDKECVRKLLKQQILQEKGDQGSGDVELMKLCCTQLFNNASIDDIFLIWSAKTSSMDADCTIDVQFLCWAGVGATKKLLYDFGGAEALSALSRLQSCEMAGDFEKFEPSVFFAQQENYWS